ncbi:MAG: hypothetical protein M1840_005773 [Geoglossum simile]|nr:MAG: hypothetical protein M1840_005773 [Geoglossum simile]
MGSPVWIRWEPRTLETSTWRYIDGKGETVAQSDIALGGNTVQQLYANVQFQARSAIATANRRYTYSLTQYEMRREIYHANRNHNDLGNPMVPNDGHEQEENLYDASDEELYGRQEDTHYDEWLKQLEEEGINPNGIA